MATKLPTYLHAATQRLQGNANEPRKMKTLPRAIGVAIRIKIPVGIDNMAYASLFFGPKYTEPSALIELTKQLLNSGCPVVLTKRDWTKRDW